MKKNFVKVVFAIDASSSMSSSVFQTIEGVNEFLKTQRDLEDGDVEISMYQFGSRVHKIFEHKNIKDVKDLTVKDYVPTGMTALYDGVGTAIDDTGKYLAAMNEADRPEQVIVFIVTDGDENYSKDYNLTQIQKMISEQTDKYSWQFMYIGVDLSNADAAKDMGIQSRGFATRKSMENVWDGATKSVSAYRCMSFADANQAVADTMNWMNSEYSIERGIDKSKL